MRALAVVAVIFDHLLHWPSGGFIGVDVFFVISGFLITGILLRSHERTGIISFREFYTKRVRRIVPAATVVLIATVVAAYSLFNASRAGSTLWDALSSLFFVANWHFAAAGTDYFAAAGPVSPLQHYWSLSVEEQFYLVWPALMVLIFVVCAKILKRQDRNRLVVGAAMALILLASFVFAVWETATNPTLAYFSTLSRAWELGAGALLAIAAPFFTRIPAAARVIGGWLGLTILVASMFLISSTVSFPAPWAALPVAATALIIACGIAGPQRYLLPLHNPVSTFLGSISYSLYLWHFPIIVFTLLVLPAQTFEVNLLILGLVLIVATVSYYFIEQPFHFSPWLADFQGSALRRRDAWATWRARFAPQFKWGGFGALFVVAVVGTTAMLSAPVASSSYVPHVATASSSTSTAGAAGAAAASTTPSGAPATAAASPLATEISTALAATAWPDLTPSLDDVIGGPESQPDIAACAGTSPASATDCTWGSSSAPKTAVIVGDSTGVAYAETLKTLAESGSSFRFESLAVFGCTFSDVPTDISDPTIASQCSDRKAAAVARINEIKPDVVFITNTYRQSVNGETKLPVTFDQWSTGMKSIVAKFSANAGKIVFLSPPPSGANVADCYTKISKPADCITTVDDQWIAMQTLETRLASTVGGVAVDSRAWFCVDNKCPAFVGDTPVKLDPVHMTSQYADSIAPVVGEALTADGVGL